MSEPSGRPSRTPFATYDPDTSSWRTSQPSLFSGSLPEQSVTWPVSGMTRNGAAYARPMSVPHTDATGVSSLLPTPTASEATGAGYTDRANGGGRNLRTEVVEKLLPTPRTTDLKSTVRKHVKQGQGTLAETVAVHLLPTPTARLGQSRGASHPDRRKELHPKRSGELDEVAVHLIPTPLASDAGPRGGTTGFGLRDWSRGISRGDSTNLPSAAGPPSWVDVPLPLPSLAEPAPHG